MESVEELKGRIVALENELVGACAQYADLIGEPITGLTSLLAPVPLFSVGADGLMIAVNQVGEELLAILCPGSRSFNALFHPCSWRSVRERLELQWEGAREYVVTLSNGHLADVTGAVGGEGDDRVYTFCVQDRALQHLMFDVERSRIRALSMTEFAQSVARDLNDPMAIVTGRLELLLQLDHATIDSQLWERSLRTSLQHARRVASTLHNLRLIGRGAEREFERVCLKTAASEACELLGKRGEELEIRFLSEDPEPVVGGEPAIYARVLADLFRTFVVSRYTGNEIVIQYSSGPKEVHVTVAPYLTLVAYQNGAEASLVSNSEASFQGYGIVSTLLQSVGAVIETRELGATRLFTLRMPLAPPHRVRAKTPRRGVLVVGREDLARTVKTLVGRDGFEVAGVPSAGAALERCQAENEVDYVVTDLVLPDMSGLDLADAVLSAGVTLQGRPIVISPRQEVQLPNTVRVLYFPISRYTLLTALGEKPRHLRGIRES